MNSSTVDRVLQEVRKAFGPEHGPLLSELEVSLKGSDRSKVSYVLTERGAQLSYRLGRAFTREEPQASLGLRLLALINLKLEVYPVGSEADFNARELVYPTALDRILEECEWK